jgi:hypothetical protein
MDAAPYVFFGCALLGYLIFGVTLFLWIYHTFLLLHNRTTLENIKQGAASRWNGFMSRRYDKASTYSIEEFNISPGFNFCYVLYWRS